METIVNVIAISFKQIESKGQGYIRVSNVGGSWNELGMKFSSSLKDEFLNGSGLYNIKYKNELGSNSYEVVSAKCVAAFSDIVQGIK